MERVERKRSNVWNHFDRSDHKAKCHYCTGIISISKGATANLLRHLRRKHPTIIIPEDSPGKGKTLIVWNHFDRSDHKAKCHYCTGIISIKNGSTGNLLRHLKKKHSTIIIPEDSPGKGKTLIVDKEVENIAFEMNLHDDEMHDEENSDEMHDEENSDDRSPLDLENDNSEEILPKIDESIQLKPVFIKKKKLPKDSRMQLRMEKAFSISDNQKRKSREEIIENGRMKDDCDLYGELLVSKLRKLDERTRDVAMNKIDNLLFQMKMNPDQHQTIQESEVIGAHQILQFVPITQSQSTLNISTPSDHQYISTSKLPTSSSDMSAS